MSNYRPVSILPTISKLFEKLIFQQMKDFLDSNHVLSAQQHRFQPARSCLTALISLTNRLFAARDSRLFTVIAFLDYSKAFDSLRHEIQLQRLSASSISTRTVDWFRDYLRRRQQVVKYNGILSDALSVDAGILQGSVIGPTLFNIYLNDLLRTLDQACFLAYIDNLTIITGDKSFSKVATALQELIDCISVWSKQSGLTLNPDKCKCMIIAPPKRMTSNMSPIVLNGHAFQFVDKLLLLGSTVSSSLS